ncbi:MAG: hypothetical protein ABUK01_07045 [Leptospirales bacterium]
MKKILFLISAITFATLFSACTKQHVKTEDVAANESKKERIIQHGISYGYFQSVEWGDYLHVNFRDENGKELNYWYLYQLKPNIDIEISKLKSKGPIPKKLKNSKLKIYWTRRIVYIPEAGQAMQLDELTGLEYAK